MVDIMWHRARAPSGARREREKFVGVPDTARPDSVNTGCPIVLKTSYKKSDTAVVIMLHVYMCIKIPECNILSNNSCVKIGRHLKWSLSHCWMIRVDKGRLLLNPGTLSTHIHFRGILSQRVMASITR